MPTWLAAHDDRHAAMVRRAEELHDTIDPDAAFPVDYVAFRVTGYRRDHTDPALLVGDAVRHDLRWVIDALSRCTPLPIEDDGSRTVDDWAMRLSVSPRTLRRWRDDGLRWRWLRPDGGGRAKIGHTESAITYYQEQFPQRFQNAQQFSQLTARQRETLIDEARKLSHEFSGISLSSTAERLAENHGRAHETIRLLLEKHDRENPEVAIFMPSRPPMDETEVQRVVRRHRRGTSLPKLAAQTGRSVGLLHRALLVHRAAVLERVRLTFVDSPLFRRPDADEVYLREEGVPQSHMNAGTLKRGKPENAEPPLPDVVRKTFTATAPDADVMRSRFLRYNYLKAKAHRLRSELPPRRDLRAKPIAEIERTIRHAGRLRRQLVRAALPELLSVARRQLPGHESDQAALLRLLHAGWAVLLASIESFNASGNVPFHRYLRNRLLRRFVAVEGERADRAARRESVEDLTQHLIGLAKQAGVFRN